VKRDSLEIYSKLSLADAQDKYNDVIGDFPSDILNFCIRAQVPER
jgi:hypothetical protein